MKPASLAALLCLLALAGCDAGTGGRPARDAVRLSFWHIQTSEVTRKVMEEAVGRYEMAHPGVAVTAIPVKNDAYKQKLPRAMAAGDVPDVFHTWGGGRLAEFVKAGQVADLTAELDAENVTRRILPAALEFGTVNGRIYAVPTDVAPVVMWYNTELFRKHGIAVPTTWNELKGACAKLRAAGVTPIALGNKDQWPGAFYFAYLAVRIGGTEPFANAASRAPGGSFEHPSFIEAGKLLAELAQSGAFNSGADVMNTDDARGLFIQEKTAMTLMGTWFLAELKSEAPSMLAKVDCFAFPEVRGGAGDPKIIVGGINCAYAVSSRCENLRQATGLLKELTGDVTAIRWGETGRIPALRQDLTAGMLQPATYPAARLLYQAPKIQFYYDQALPPELANRLYGAVQSIIAGTVTPAEAMREAERAAEQK